MVPALLQIYSALKALTPSGSGVVVFLVFIIQFMCGTLLVPCMELVLPYMGKAAAALLPELSGYAMFGCVLVVTVMEIVCQVCEDGVEKLTTFFMISTC